MTPDEEREQREARLRRNWNILSFFVLACFFLLGVVGPILAVVVGSMRAAK